jgi:PIN domain nuclease of toxin-antitoxin system
MPDAVTDTHALIWYLTVPRATVPDMPDRIIAATALYLDLLLISRDGKIRLSSVATIW